MNSIRKSAVLVGVLFLLQMIAASVSHSALLVPLLAGDNFLVNISSNSNSLIAAMLLDMVCGAAVLGIGVIMFPILKKHNEAAALWHFGLRLNEWVLVSISGIFLLTLGAISKDYVQAEINDRIYLQLIGNYILEARDFTKILMLLGFCMSASLFYYQIFKAKLLPVFISIWGIIGVLLLAVEVISNIYGQSAGGILIMLPMGLNEIFLGIWLIIKGFNCTQNNAV